MSANKLDLLELLEKQEAYFKYNKIKSVFPDTGPYRRSLYPKHLDFLKAGAKYGQRAFVAANRTGKTFTGAVEMSQHLTGDYEPYWEGKRFLNAIDAWAAGRTTQVTKEVMQEILLGKINDIGSGLIPKESIVRYTRKSGVPDTIETVFVRHKSGGLSELTFKSYDQRRESFQGTKKQVIWLDEEPDDPGIYSECLTRLMDKYNPGIIYCTFTPLFGLSEVVLSFLPDGLFPENGVHPKFPYKYVTNVRWAEVPHLNDEQKTQIKATYSHHEMAARTEGLPSLGSGTIYPYSERDIVVEPFEIPAWWPRGYGMDTGWNRTAVVWGAMDPDSKIIYLYSEHYVSEAHPAIHASAIKARGDWIIGAADPAGASQSDGKRIYDMFVEEGLNLVKANKKDKEGNILQVGQLFASGRLKIFSTMSNTLKEFRKYRRDDKGRIIRKETHAMDALEYFLTTGLDHISLPPDKDYKYMDDPSDRDPFTGY